MGKFVCPCGSDRFEIIMHVCDEVLFSATVYDDGNVDTIDHLKDYGGDTDLSDQFKCSKCNQTFGLGPSGPFIHGKVVPIM